MRNPAFVIPIQHLTDGDHEFELTASKPVFRDDIEAMEHIQIHADIKKSDVGIYLHCGITTSLDCCCDRCLDEYIGSFYTSYSILYISDRANPELTDEDTIRLLKPEDRHIVLDDDVHEAILIGRPVKNLCREDV